MFMNDCVDLKTFNRLFVTYQSRFIHFAYTYVRDWVVAEDLISEAFMYYWENRGSLPADSNLPAYILTTVKHKCINYLQHQQVQEEVAGQLRRHAEWALCTRIATLEDCNPNELFSEEIRQIIARTLATLPEQSRRIFRMSRYENKTHKEIASLLGITPKGVEFHIAKVLRELRLFKLSLRTSWPGVFTSAPHNSMASNNLRSFNRICRCSAEASSHSRMAFSSSSEAVPSKNLYNHAFFMR